MAATCFKPKSMELTFKLVLDQRHQKKDHTYPIKLRIYQERDYKECSLGVDILVEQWDSQLQLVLPSNIDHKIFKY